MHEETSRLTIVRRDDSGKPVSIYPHDSREYACILRSLNLSKSYFKVPRVDHALLDFIQEHEQFEPNPWYKDSAHGFESAEHTKDYFFGHIFAHFCMLAVDPNIDNPDFLSARVNREYDGPFLPRDHCILLNLPRVNDMVAAREIMLFNGDDKSLRTFQYNFAMAFFREICSLFVTFLTKGRTVTRSPWSGEQGNRRMLDKDEFAGYMENVLFGGKIRFYRDPFLNARQSGIPHVVTEDGARKVSLQTIYDMTEVSKIDKEFPIVLEDPLIRTDRMVTMGQYHPPVTLTDPMSWGIMHKIKRRQRRA